jgi:O-antigen/teichoic acid export membrane protein
MEPAPSAREMLRGTFQFFAAEGLLIPTGLLTAAFLSRRLGPEGYGLFTLAVAFITWVEWSITALFSRATIKLVGDADDWRPVGTTVIQLHLAISCGALVLIWLLAPTLAGILGEPVLAGYLRLLALDIPLFTLARAHRGILIGTGGFRQQAWAGATRWISRLVLIVLFVQLGFSIEGAILGTIGASLLELALARYYVRPPLFHRSSFKIRRLWGLTIPLFFFALSMRLFEKLDLFALTALGGTAAHAGQYGAAQNLSVVPGVFALSFSPLLLSTLTRLLRAGDEGQARWLARDALRAVLWLLPFAALLAGSAGEVVVLLFGSAFLPAAPLLALLIFSAIALVMISVTTAILTAGERPGWTAILAVALLPGVIGAHMVLIPRLGPVGAALATTLVAMGGATAATGAVYAAWRILPPVATLARSLLLCVIMYGLATYWPASGILLVIKLSLLAAGIVGGFVAGGEFSREELAQVRGMLHTVRSPAHPSTEV